MLALKKASDIKWGELKFIENPITAKNIILRNNSSLPGRESILYASDFNLPKATSSSIDPYAQINRQLESGSVFLLNSSTTNPLLKDVKLVDCRTACCVAPGQNAMLMNATRAMLNLVPIPASGTVSGETAPQASAGTAPVAKKQREKHQVLFTPRLEDGTLITASCKVMIVVLNKTKNTVAVKVEKNIADDGFSRIFQIDTGDQLEFYCFASNRKDLKAELNTNNHLDTAISENRVKKLTANLVEPKAGNVTLHSFDYIKEKQPILTLTRIKQTANTTVGELTLNTQPDKKWYVLEPGGPDSNKAGGKRIPKGRYPLKQYSSKSYPAEYEVSSISGRSKIIFYEYEKSIGMMAGLCPGDSYKNESGEYKVENSLDAKKEIYEALKYSEKPEIIIKSDLSLKILKDKLWSAHEILNEYAAALKPLNLKKGNDGDLVTLIQQSLNKAGFHVVEDGDYGPSLHLAVKYFQKFYNKDFDSRKEVHEISKLKVDACIGKETLLALDEALVNNWKVDFTEAEYRVRAFLRMIRVGEGTIGDIGYETLFTHKSFIKDFDGDFSAHPNILMKGGGLKSTAAGAYQVLNKTWLWITSIGYAVRHKISDFTPLAQDKVGILLLRSRDFGRDRFEVKDSDTGDAISVLNLIVDNRMVEAIELASWEWASLPPGRHGQPIKSMKEAKELYYQYLEDENCHISDLKIGRNILKEFLT
jgi:muramidase (phage lysozyme)